MLYWRYSSNRIFFINEYWIFVPTAAVVNYVVIRRILSHKQKVRRLKELKEKIEREKKWRRIFFLSLGLNISECLLLRGGSEAIINVDYIECGIEAGLRYLDDARLRKIIHDLYRNKRTGNVIYITATALCHLSDRYGKMFLALPIAVGDFGISNLYVTIRKFVTSVLLGAVGPFVIWGGPFYLSLALIFAMAGLRVAHIDLESVANSPVYQLGSSNDNVADIKPRMPNSPDVIVVNNRNKELIMSNPVQKKGECWLADQTLLNPNCKVKATQIPATTHSFSSSLEYEKIVNMQDITGLNRERFSDEFDLGGINIDKLDLSGTKASISSPPRKSKLVNFLDKFGDPEKISQDETWRTTESPVLKKKYIRTKN